MDVKIRSSNQFSCLGCLDKHPVDHLEIFASIIHLRRSLRRYAPMASKCKIDFGKYNVTGTRPTLSN